MRNACGRQIGATWRSPARRRYAHRPAPARAAAPALLPPLPARAWLASGGRPRLLLRARGRRASVRGGGGAALGHSARRLRRGAGRAQSGTLQGGPAVGAMPPQQQVVSAHSAVLMPLQGGVVAAKADGDAERQQQQPRQASKGRGAARRPVDPSALQRGVLAGIEEYERAKERQATADAGAQRRSYDDVRLEMEAAQADVQEAAQTVEFIKAGANAAFKRALSSEDAAAAAALGEAMNAWAEALDACSRPPLAATATANRLVEVLHCNRAAALLKLERFADARRECELALTINPDCVKALYRAAEALYELGGFSKAVTLLERALRFEPNSHDVRTLLDDCEDALEEEGDQLFEAEAATRGQSAQAQGAKAAGGLDADAGDGQADDSEPENEDDAKSVTFARAVMAQTAEAWIDTGGEHEEEIVMRHARPDGSQLVGKFQVGHAFDSEAMLEQCTG